MIFDQCSCMTVGLGDHLIFDQTRLVQFVYYILVPINQNTIKKMNDKQHKHQDDSLEDRFN
jgi:hypothetical protein